MSIKSIIILLSPLIILQYSYGQAGKLDANDSLDLRVISGGFVTFNYKSVKEINDGMSYSNWTTLRLYLKNENVGAENFEVTFYANSNRIYGETDTTLELNTIEVKATCSDCINCNCGDVSSPEEWPDLDVEGGASTVILTGIKGDPAGSIYIFDISYRCGLSGLLGKRSDYYFVDITFDVE